LWTQAEAGDHDFIMFDHRFAGIVLVNGQPRKLNINGNLMGRTVIQVDGATVYDEKPFLQKEDIDFQVIPGKQAKMRWHRVSPLKMECDIFVDNAITTLPSLARDGTARALVCAHSRKMFEARAFGAGMWTLAVFSFWLNRNELMDKNEYYPKLLSLIPGLILMGILLLAKPEWADFSPKNKLLMWGTIGATVLMLLFGYTIFTDWFIGIYDH
jgi:hypothetical protein